MENKKYCWECEYENCKNRLPFPDDLEPINCEKYIIKKYEKIFTNTKDNN